MKQMSLIVSLILMSGLSAENPQALVNSLTTVSPIFNNSENQQKKIPGFLYVAEDYNNIPLALSYWVTNEYFSSSYGSTDATGKNPPFTVTDVYQGESGNPAWGMTVDLNSPGANLQIERVNIANGADIYDTATYQIALALAQKNGLNAMTSDFATLISNQNQLLAASTGGYDGNARHFTSAGFAKDANRATDPAHFTYQSAPKGTKIQPANAYYFRMVTQNWYSSDPFQFDPKLKNYISQTGNPPVDPQHAPGNITWLDWKPITGENVWAYLLGPMQSILISGDTTSVSSQLAIKNATSFVTGLKWMQSKLTGAIYYAVFGSLDNGNTPVKKTEISTENNASALAGLLVFRQVLSNMQGQKNTIDLIDDIIYGKSAQGTNPINNPKGILGYFKNFAWNHEACLFYQGGDEETGSFTPTSEPKAVDVNTWGMTALGPQLIDKWFGPGAAYKCWQNVKSWGGFYAQDGTTLLGVGYSDQDGNGPDGNLKGIHSAEWTFGAITLVRALMSTYGDTYPDLVADENSMVRGVVNLRTDNYGKSPFYKNTRAPNWNALVTSDTNNLAYVYASKRYAIPFGWFANPIPSLCSTSWALIVNYNFNPFSAKGTYEPSPVISTYGQRTAPVKK